VARTIRLVVVALVAALAVGACGTLVAGEKISAPEGEVVLTVSGNIGARNNGKTLELDLASIEQMRRVRLEAAEPFLKRRVMFEGVLLADLLAVAGVPESANTISLTALDDYKVDFKVADVRSSQMLLATKADGKHMPVDRSGPIRIVFPDSSSLGRNPDLWIWSVSNMKVA
jgi:hypothetical protein